jgi:hypothetical protein
MGEDDKSIVGQVKTGAEAIGALVQVAGDHPKIKEAGAELAQTALTVSKTVNTLLMPLAAINFAVDKARNYFRERFEQDLLKRTESIPADQLIEPKAALAGPAIQALAFVHEEEDLSDMFLQLLASAMDARNAAKAHPAFVEIVKQLDPREAGVLKAVLQNTLYSPETIVEIVVRERASGMHGPYRVLRQHLIDYVDEKTGQPIQDDSMPAMCDNWVRLGLIHISYDTMSIVDGAYDWVATRPEFVMLRQIYEDQKYMVNIRNGQLRVTSFGTQFAAALRLRRVAKGIPISPSKAPQ